MRFVKKGKLTPWYIRPYRISKRVGDVSNELEFSEELAAVHPIFNIFMLKNFLVDLSLFLPTENCVITDNLPYEEILVHIFDRQVSNMRTQDVSLVKVLWTNQYVKEATWGVEKDKK